MSIATTVGAQGLWQLGVSMGDIALIYKQGRKIGNWLMAKRNDEDLFETLGEPADVFLKRKGIVEPARMESLFPDTRFFYHGEQVSTSNKQINIQHGELGPFSWLMAVIVTGLDICLPQPKVMEMLIEVFLHILDNPDADSALRMLLEMNVESWRSFGIVRSLSTYVHGEFRRAWKDKTGIDAIPQLNLPEEQEMVKFLECLLGSDGSDFTCISATTFAVASSIQSCGIHIITDGARSFEGQLRVVTGQAHLAGGSAAKPEFFSTAPSS